MDEGYERMMQESDETGYVDKLKHPEIGHVLYLKIGSKVNGPTVIWNATNGGQLQSQKVSEMVVVPAV